MTDVLAPCDRFVRNGPPTLDTVINYEQKSG